jgi:hypothetical protein
VLSSYQSHGGSSTDTLCDQPVNPAAQYRCDFWSCKRWAMHENLLDSRTLQVSRSALFGIEEAP